MRNGNGDAGGERGNDTSWEKCGMKFIWMWIVRVRELDIRG